VAALFSLVVSLVAGMLSSAAGSSAASSVLFGGGAFDGCLALTLTVLGALGVLER
jgi:hypothetical protein